MRGLLHGLSAVVDFVLRNEAVVFISLLGFHAVPVVLFPLFPTVDGPVHLYNANLLRHYLFEGWSLPEFLIYGDLITNWLGHGLMAITLVFLSPEWTETAIQLVCVIGIPVALRCLLVTIGGNSVFSYFAFPFSYSFLFFFGFYNFILSIILAMMAMVVWMRNQEKWSSSRFFLCTLLFMACAFSHVFGFVFAILIVVVVSAHSLVLRDEPLHLGTLAMRFLPLSIGMGITMMFVWNRSHIDAPDVYFSAEELWRLLLSVSPAKGISYGGEGVFTQWVMYLLYIMTALSIFRLVMSFLVHGVIDTLTSFLRAPVMPWLLITMVLLIAYFWMPDGKEGVAGFVSSRLLLLFFLLLFVVFSMLRFGRPLRFVVLVVMTYISVGLLEFYLKSNAKNAAMASAIVTMSSTLEPGSIVLPVVATDNFLLSHVSGYLGVKKPVILLDNYEAALDYFPLKWKRSSLPAFSVSGHQFVDGCSEWANGSSGVHKSVDWVFLIRDVPNACSENMRALIPVSSPEIHELEEKLMLFRIL